MFKVGEIVFTGKNIEHIARHSVTVNEVRSVIGTKPIFIDAKLGRIMAVGPTKLRRILSIVLSKINENTYYVVTARDANKKEKQKYKDETGGVNK